MHGMLPKVAKITISIRNNEGNVPFCHVLCLGMHSNVMFLFMVQALQDPLLCSSTLTSTLIFLCSLLSLITLC